MSITDALSFLFRCRARLTSPACAAYTSHPSGTPRFRLADEGIDPSQRGAAVCAPFSPAALPVSIVRLEFKKTPMQIRALHRFLLTISSFRLRCLRSTWLPNPTRRSPTIAVSVRHVVPDRGALERAAIAQRSGVAAFAPSSPSGLSQARLPSPPLRAETRELDRGT